MKITNLKIENIKKIKAIDITPTDNTVIIAGANGQGKTSVLDSIMFALAGRKAIDTKPIRHGETHAEINLDLGEYKVKRVFEDNSSRLEVFNSDNSPCSSPQALLDKICGKISFDPLAFSMMDKHSQLKLFKELIGVDFTELDVKREKAYTERTDKKRLLGILKADLKFEPKEGLEEVSVTALSEELTTKLKEQQYYVTLKGYITDKENEVGRLYSEQTLIKEQIRKAEDELQEKNQMMITCKEVSDEVIDEIKRRIESAEDDNGYARLNNSMFEIKQKIEFEDRLITELSTSIKGIDSEKKNIIAKANVPITGLSMTEDDGVMLDTIPFAQVNDAEKLKVSVAIAMAMNPELKVIRITNGSLLDNANLEIIKSMVKEKDYQIWIEKVDESGQVGIIIEDGEVKQC